MLRARGGRGQRIERGTHLIKFFVRIRGARTPPPRIDEPVTQIPLRVREGALGVSALSPRPSAT